MVHLVTDDFLEAMREGMSRLCAKSVTVILIQFSQQ